MLVIYVHYICSLYIYTYLYIYSMVGDILHCILSLYSRYRYYMSLFPILSIYGKILQIPYTKAPVAHKVLRLLIWIIPGPVRVPTYSMDGMTS